MTRSGGRTASTLRRSDGGESAVQLATKVTPPGGPMRLVDRAALVADLEAARPRLTLLSAPAGWGKTSLLAQWVATADKQRRLGWLSLDSSDNDPSWFWTCVIAALRRAHADIGRRASELLGMGADPLQVFLPTLLNELAALNDSVILVLDDYHIVENRAVHEQLAFFVERLPATVRLVLSTRSDPPLPLARLRARRELLEIRTDDLRFLDVEAADLLTDILGLDLTATEVELLSRRTEGWAAGLCLAALSLAGRADAAEFIRTFAGDNRHIVDYLMAEVLAGQTPSRRDFLLRTSIVRRLNGQLCDAMLDSTDSSMVLREIERENLFVLPLDSSRQWYRYHQLFAELLSAELHRVDGDRIAGLHSRAARWFESQALLDEAVHHLSAAGDVARTADLIAANWGAEFSRGRLSTVSSWLDRLPVEKVAADPRLALARAWIAFNLGHLDSGARWIDALEAALASDDSSDEFLETQVRVLHAVNQFKSGSIAMALETASSVIADERDKAPLGASGSYCIGAHCVYGAGKYFAGDLDDAREALDLAVQLAEMVGDHRARIYCLGYLATISAEAGRLDVAQQQINLIAGNDEHVPADKFVGLMASLATAIVAEASGDEAVALDAVDIAVAAARLGGGILEVAKALVVRARILEQLGDLDAARVSRKEAAGLIELPAVSGIDPGQIFHPGFAANAIARTGEELSEREREILCLLGTQLSRREIGEQLFVSINTIKTHQRVLYRKLGVTNRAAAVRRGQELGLG
jgi:LuxR family transcriptional regulator, maltose regulon positive regulatory protein